MRLFRRLLALQRRGIACQEYDPKRRQMLGNFPQALSHMALINTACNLSRTGGPAKHRSQRNSKRSEALPLCRLPRRDFSTLK
jgi:hypothetical protein